MGRVGREDKRLRGRWWAGRGVLVMSPLKVIGTPFGKLSHYDPLCFLGIVNSVKPICEQQPFWKILFGRNSGGTPQAGFEAMVG